MIAFKEGIVFHSGYKCKEAELKILSQSNQESRAEVTISEGKFHQVKRMFAQLGNEVVYLKRVKMGALELDPALPPGGYRELSEEEIALLSTN